MANRPQAAGRNVFEPATQEFVRRQFHLLLNPVPVIDVPEHDLRIRDVRAQVPCVHSCHALCGIANEYERRRGTLMAERSGLGCTGGLTLGSWKVGLDAEFGQKNDVYFCMNVFHKFMQSIWFGDGSCSDFV